jgi:phospholipid transport system transporter-binding protein
MQQARIVNHSASGFALEGRLDFDSVHEVESAGLDLISGAQGDFAICLEQVVYANSSALALLMCWLRLAQAQAVLLRFLNVPEKLQALMDLYGLKAILPLSATSELSRTSELSTTSKSTNTSK